MSNRRRTSCPVALRHIWDAIGNIRHQRQGPTAERISHFIQRKSSAIENIEKQLNCALKDELIRLARKVGTKGAMIGVEQDSYVLPETTEFEKGSHDWYCFECHRSGVDLSCESCFRVYHRSCGDGGRAKDGDGFVCPVCKMLKLNSSLKLKKDELNTLLMYTCNRLKEKSKEDVQFSLSKMKSKYPDETQEYCDLSEIELPEGDEWQYEFLIYYHMDLVTMEKKALAKEYRRFDEFKVDAMTVVHNIGVLYGGKCAARHRAIEKLHTKALVCVEKLSLMGGLVKEMLKDCLYDLGEIQQCHDCYRMSNEKRDKSWFCQPCNPPHELVYAKQVGYPFWPAKVIRKTDDMYDVRFFGTLHQRANITKTNIKPITICASTLRVKRTTTWVRALDELKRHQQLLKKSDPEDRHSSEEDAEVGKPKSKKAKAGKGKARRRRTNRKRTRNKPVPVDESQSQVQHNAEPLISSSLKQTQQQVATSDDYNVVSSSSQELLINCASIGTQTLKGMFKEKTVSKSVQTDLDPLQGSRGDSKQESDALKVLTSKLKAIHKADKEKALQKLSVKLDKKHFEDKEKAIATAVSTVQDELLKTQEQEKELHEQELKLFNERRRSELSDAKKKQWCYNCELEAVYHCCWNTSYCSVECQQLHWQKEHKRTCRRKR